MTKRIGILTSGGDCAGLNAAIRAATHAAHTRGWQMVGIQNGYTGLLDPAHCTHPLTLDETDFNMLIQGGTVLGTYNKYYPHDFQMPDGTRKDRSGEVIAGIQSLNLDGLIGIGGDGSMAMFARLCAAGNIPFVGIPKTMDKDIGLTETTIGFDTAVGVATQALENLHATARSHHRTLILEVMGRDAGHVALHTGIAGGADAILIPEIVYSFDDLRTHIQARLAQKGHALVVVSESIRAQNGQKMMMRHSNGDARYGGVGPELAAALAEQAGLDTRAVVLGHVQRGAPPSPADRILAAELAVQALDLVGKRVFNQMVGVKEGRITSFDIAEVAKTPGIVDVSGHLVHSTRSMGIYMGDAPTS